MYSKSEKMSQSRSLFRARRTVGQPDVECEDRVRQPKEAEPEITMPDGEETAEELENASSPTNEVSGTKVSPNYQTSNYDTMIHQWVANSFLQRCPSIHPSTHVSQHSLYKDKQLAQQGPHVCNPFLPCANQPDAGQVPAKTNDALAKETKEAGCHTMLPF